MSTAATRCTLGWTNGRRLDTEMNLLRNVIKYEGWNFNSGNYLFTTDTK